MSQFILRSNRLRREPGQWRVIACVASGLVGVTLMSGQALAAKPKKPGSKPAPVAEPDTNDKPAPPLPADLNLASLRVKALDQLYELDLSVDQLKVLRAAATVGGSTQQRTAAKGNENLAAKLRELAGALLDRKDGARIDTLRNDVAELIDDDDVQLDDVVRITTAARTKSPELLKQINASQIAAFLASHADEVGDPVEMMVGAVEQIRDARVNQPTKTDTEIATTADKAAPEKPAADEKRDDDAEFAALVRETAIDVGGLAAGLDDDRAKCKRRSNSAALGG